SDPGSVSHSVHVLANSGSGNFSEMHSIPIGDATTELAVADFDGDGRTDIFAVIYRDAESRIAVLHNLGGLQFAQTSLLYAGNGPSRLTAADFNHDGLPDLVSVDDENGGVAVIPGQPAGFAQNAAFACGVRPSAIAAARMNDDTFIDVVVANEG